MQEINSMIGVRRKCCNSDKEAFDLTRCCLRWFLFLIFKSISKKNKNKSRSLLRLSLFKVIALLLISVMFLIRRGAGRIILLSDRCLFAVAFRKSTDMAFFGVQHPFIRVASVLSIGSWFITKSDPPKYSFLNNLWSVACPGSEMKGYKNANVFLAYFWRYKFFSRTYRINC